VSCAGIFKIVVGQSLGILAGKGSLGSQLMVWLNCYVLRDNYRRTFLGLPFSPLDSIDLPTSFACSVWNDFNYQDLAGKVLNSSCCHGRQFGGAQEIYGASFNKHFRLMPGHYLSRMATKTFHINAMAPRDQHLTFVKRLLHFPAPWLKINYNRVSVLGPEERIKPAHYTSQLTEPLSLARPFWSF